MQVKEVLAQINAAHEAIERALEAASKLEPCAQEDYPETCWELASFDFITSADLDNYTEFNLRLDARIEQNTAN